MSRKIIMAVALFYLLAAILGVLNVSQGNFSQISWVFAPLGIFIWGDALIIGPFMVLGSLWLWHKNSSTWNGLFLSVYAAVRSFTEVIYDINAQFSTVVRPWEGEWKNFGFIKSLGIPETYVLSQLIFITIFIISTLVFVNYLKKYLKSS